MSTPKITCQAVVDYLCSRARAATLEAKQPHRQSGPNPYYHIWKARMKQELVSCTIPS
jgi:hypothetical protein